MRNWRTMVGALCIVLAMVLGAFAGFVYARPGGVGASPDLGTRGEDRRLASASDELQKALSPEEADEVAVRGTVNTPTSLTGSEQVELVVPGGPTARTLSETDRETAKELQVGHFSSKDGTVTVKHAEPKADTRGGALATGFDAGGPYGGPDTFEGTDLTIQVDVFDPAILFFRYDWENDGVFDYPDQTGYGNMGRWTTETTITKRFNDNVFGTLLVQGWDGVSTTIEFNNGDNLGEPMSFGWWIGYGDYVFAWQFQAKADLTVSELGHYHYVFPAYEMGFWDESGNLLGTCEATHNWFEWNWCTLPSSVSVSIGEHYRVGIRINEWTPAIDTPSDPDKVHFEGTYYCYGGGSLCSPTTYWTDIFIPMIDFRWSEVLILPDAQEDTASIEVNNVAPIVFDVTTTPDPGLEGSPTEFSASFEDPGIDDTWEFRWSFHDGEVSPWVRISKYDGGAKVLFLHTWSDGIGALHTAVADACGVFCVQIDEFDFGPIGQNRAPSLDEVLPYHLLIVGTNYFNTHSEEIGDLLADYMDQGGNVLMMQAGFDNSFGDIAGITGRWESDEYSPVARGFAMYWYASLGAIYVPGHPFFDGVASISGALRAGTYGVTSGAEHIADWDEGNTLAATKLNPMVDNGAMACALNIFPYQGWTSGDWVQMVANAIRYCSQQPDPVYKSMPLQLDPYKKTYKDDEPTTTTPEDSFPMTVEVRDDDHGKLKVLDKQELFYNDFEDPAECSGYYWMPSTWPAGWWADPDGYGWTCGYDYYAGARGPYIWYYYNNPLYGTGDGHSHLYTDTYDLSSFNGLQMEFSTYWWADYTGGVADGFVEASQDGGATWTEIASYHTNDPAQYRGDVFLETSAIGGSADTVFRFRFEAGYYFWSVDNVRIVGVLGEVMSGLGSAEGIATIANVPPTAVGGFDTALRTEAQGLLFKGFEVSDPAILEPTEWFAYAWNFDDGTAVDWVYVGSLAPPKLDVFIVHTLCLSGNGCAEYQGLEKALLKLDDVGTVDSHNFINYPNLPNAPTLTTMLQYDVVIIATNWAYFSYPPFDLARRQVGDRAAAYLDAGRGGVISTMAVYDNSPYYGDIFMIRGRYIDEDYGPFEKADYLFSPQNKIGTIYEPDHDLFVKVGENIGSMYISGGDYKRTVGGQNNAAGRNGVLLADWPNGNSAIGMKELNNGMRTVHFGLFAQTTGSDTPMLWRNAIGWASGGIPSPKIPAFAHTWGDNGIYTVDFMAIDDDMGFVWDFGANMPMEVIPGVDLSHRFVEVAVDNVEPTIDLGSLEAFIATETCLRVTGQAGNTVSLKLYTDGVLTTSVSVTRMNGDPNPPTEKCGMVKVDVLAPHTYYADLTYADPNGGSNPTWLIFEPWREPVTPGHGTISLKYDLDTAGTTSISLDTLKQDLFAGGRGAKIDFVAEAYDPGTDDLAFLWSWGSEAGATYDLSADAVYAIHVHHNDGLGRTDGVLEGPQYLGFSEPYFDRDANDERTPAGTMGFRVRDTAVHAFEGGQALYYVFLLVLDDDNGRGYPSTFGLDGIDVEIIVVDLR